MIQLKVKHNKLIDKMWMYFKYLISGITHHGFHTLIPKYLKNRIRSYLSLIRRKLVNLWKYYII